MRQVTTLISVGEAAGRYFRLVYTLVLTGYWYHHKVTFCQAHFAKSNFLPSLEEMADLAVHTTVAVPCLSRGSRTGPRPDFEGGGKRYGGCQNQSIHRLPFPPSLQPLINLWVAPLTRRKGIWSYGKHRLFVNVYRSFFRMCCQGE